MNSNTNFLKEKNKNKWRNLVSPQNKTLRNARQEHLYNYVMNHNVIKSKLNNVDEYFISKPKFLENIQSYSLPERGREDQELGDYIATIFNKKLKTLSKAPIGNSYYVPWVQVLKTVNGTVRNNSQLHVSGISQNYSLNFIKNNRFPSVELKKKRGSNGLEFTHIGHFCKSNSFSAANPSICSSKSKMIMKDKKQIYTKQLRGLSIQNLTNELKKTTSDLSLKRNLLNLKRLGDYSQVLTCKSLNQNRDRFIIKPEDEQIQNLIKSYKSGNMSEDLYLRTMTDIAQNGRYKYQNALFWTLDSPAGFLSLLYGVPYVFVSNKTKIAYFNPCDFRQYILQRPANDILDSHNKLIYVKNKWKERRPQKLKKIVIDAFDIVEMIINTFKTNESHGYKMLCIIDTIHDFGKSHINIKWSKVYDILKSQISGNLNLINLLDKMNDTHIEKIKLVENIFNSILQVGTHSFSVKKQDVNTTSIPLIRFLRETDMCIIHDAGYLPQQFKDYRAMTPSRIFDPATAELHKEVSVEKKRIK
jgi:hypothetical protein